MYEQWESFYEYPGSRNAELMETHTIIIISGRELQLMRGENAEVSMSLIAANYPRVPPCLLPRGTLFPFLTLGVRYCLGVPLKIHVNMWDSPPPLCRLGRPQPSPHR